MQEIKHILFVPHSPEQPINAVILAKKLSKAATALGISNHVATSVEHLDLSNVIDTVVFVGQKSADADQLRDKVVKVIGLNNAQHDAIMLLQQVLEHSDALDETIAANVGVTRFVAITACPTGVAHTFMAAEALQQGAVKHGYQIDVETQGSVGAKNILSAESIAKADVVILATDIEVNTDRFVGKRVYRCSTGFALKQTDKTFANAIAEAKVLETGKQTATKTENENKQDFQQNVNNSSMPQNPQTIIIRQEEKSTNGIGTAGFIMSLIAIFLGWIPIIGWIIWILGLVLSFAGIFKRPKGMAIAGLVISLIGIIMLVFVFGILMVAAASK